MSDARNKSLRLSPTAARCAVCALWYNDGENERRPKVAECIDRKTMVNGLIVHGVVKDSLRNKYMQLEYLGYCSDIMTKLSIRSTERPVKKKEIFKECGNIDFDAKSEERGIK